MSRAAHRAISHLRSARDELEQAGRVPGELVTITRQVLDLVINNIGVAGVCIRQMAEGDDE
jgi:hypothetical protein